MYFIWCINLYKKLVLHVYFNILIYNKSMMFLEGIFKI